MTTASTGPSTGLRARRRQELLAAIRTAALEELRRSGAAGLSLRAVARDVGIAVSALYRYFPSRDDLLTALIIDGYNAVGEVVEAADAACAQDEYMGRWLAVCRAVRGWALAHPHEYALLYGSPVPGYRAPQDTIGPRTRDVAVYGRILSDAHRAEALRPPEGGPPPPKSFAPDAGQMREMVMPGLPDDVVARALATWTTLFGMVSFEVFGQFNNVITDRDAFFDHLMTGQAHYLGLAAAHGLGGGAEKID
jgi:AcrR family transcriptional regulator